MTTICARNDNASGLCHLRKMQYGVYRCDFCAGMFRMIVGEQVWFQSVRERKGRAGVREYQYQS